MLRKSSLFLLCLLSLLTIHLTAYSQPADTTKPYCLTPAQRRFVLSQAYQLQECDSVLGSYKIQLNDARNVIKYDTQHFEILDDQLAEERDRSAARLKDVAFVTDQLHIKNRKVRLLRIGLFTISGVAVLELGYIGVKSIGK